MNKVFGYCRVSTKNQHLDRQISNIKEHFPLSIFYTEHFTGTTSNRPQWEKLCNTVQPGDTIVMDSVSRMSRNAEEGFNDYQLLFAKGVNLIFLKEPHINTSTYKQATTKDLNINVSTGNDAVDEYFSANIDLINILLMKLAKQQIKLAFEQSEKEVSDLHIRISEGMRESAKRGTKIGLTLGTNLITKKSIKCKDLIKKHSKLFGGTLSDKELIILCKCTRNTFYKYKYELTNC